MNGNDICMFAIDTRKGRKQQHDGKEKTDSCELCKRNMGRATKTDDQGRELEEESLREARQNRKLIKVNEKVGRKQGKGKEKSHVSSLSALQKEVGEVGLELSKSGIPKAFEFGQYNVPTST